MEESCPFYTVYCLDGRVFFTYDPPETWKEKEDGWDKWWVVFKDLNNHIVELNPDLITCIMHKDKVTPILKRNI